MQNRGCVEALCLLLALSAAALGATGAKSESALKVSHAPKQPRTGERVVLTVQVPSALRADHLVVQYQVVEPGKYIDFLDPAYGESWTNLALSNAAADKPEATRVTLTAELPAKLQTNRRLIRYRLYSPEDSEVVAPASGDTQRNFAYFVYDGIPEWQGAINPRGSAGQRKVVRYDAKVMAGVQAYHLISKQRSIVNVTWSEPKGFMDPSASEYQYTATLVADGKVYDHVRFRARGGTWRHAMGKNMWKIDFLKGHHLEARDNWGQKYQTKWGKLNLGACIQQGNYGMRGEQGMLEALSFRLFNLAGVEAPHTHWVQLRIIDSPEETPADQYRGDFWGLYLALENLDDDFLEEHGLPEGNLYKMDFTGPEPQHLAPGFTTNCADVRQLMSALRRNQEADWWLANVDLPRYYSYRSILECVHHYDVGAGKNYYYFHDLEAKRWRVIPWDVDLTWGDHMYGNGAEPFYRTGLLQRDPFKAAYEARLTEIRDLLFNPEQAGALIDEYAAVIGQPDDGPSIAHADRARWDYHPIMSSQYTQRGKSDPGLFYKNSPTQDFKGMAQLMKQYVERRGQWIDQTLLADAVFAATPTIAPANIAEVSIPALKLRLSSPTSAAKVRWRLAEITPGKSSKTKARFAGKYEINALWEKDGEAMVEIPTKAIEKGHTYRIRARIQDDQGRWSHWSAPEQFSAK